MINLPSSWPFNSKLPSWISNSNPLITILLTLVNSKWSPLINIRNFFNLGSEFIILIYMGSYFKPLHLTRNISLWTTFTPFWTTYSRLSMIPRSFLKRLILLKIVFSFGLSNANSTICSRGLSLTFSARLCCYWMVLVNATLNSKLAKMVWLILKAALTFLFSLKIY